MPTLRLPHLRWSAISLVGAVALLMSASFGSAAAVSPAVAVSCTYDAANHKVTLAMTGDSSVATHLARDVDGHITVENNWCGAATVTNTDSILVTGDSGNQTLWIVLRNGGFKPGFTNEPGKSDEIEITVTLGGGTNDTIQVSGDDAGQNFRLGQVNSQLGLIRQMNLNAGESTGVDADLLMLGIERTFIYGEGGPDRISGQGGAGTGDPFGAALSIYGNKGNDWIEGGSGPDSLTGNEGKDKVWGKAGKDKIYLNDNVPGNDYGRGGKGADYCIADPQDDCKT
jgi:Ca2+-binding RTX toxin-like protein